MRYRGVAHLGTGVVAGLAVGAVAGLLWSPSLGWPLGWAVGTLTYAAVTWIAVWNLDGERTRALATSEDVGRPLVDVVVLVAALVSVAVIGLVLVGGGSHQPDAPHVGIGVVAIAGSWLAVHTMFWLRYVRIYYAEDPGAGIGFSGGEDAPRYSDFAYVAFTVAMTFQVSDTGITTNRMRRAVLGHALTSFVFVAVILAVVINVVGSLA